MILLEINNFVLYIINNFTYGILRKKENTLKRINTINIYIYMYISITYTQKKKTSM